MPLTRPADLKTLDQIEDAIFDWIEEATGLGVGRIFFGDQDIVAPEGGSYVTIQLTGGRKLGSIDPTILVHHPETLDPLADLEKRTEGVRELEISIQAFTESTLGTGSAHGVLLACQDALQVQRIRDDLNAGGVSVFDSGRVNRLNKVMNGDFEGRAALDVRAYVRAAFSDFLGYIASVEVTDDVTGNTQTIPLP